MKVSAGVCVPKAVDMAAWFRSRAGECVLPLYKFHFLKWQLPYKRGKKKKRGSFALVADTFIKGTEKV